MQHSTKAIRDLRNATLTLDKVSVRPTSVSGTTHTNKPSIQSMLTLSTFRSISRLGVFLNDVKIGKPLQRVPVYAEIVLGGDKFTLPSIKGVDKMRQDAPQLEPMIIEEMKAYFGTVFLAAQTENWLANLLIFVGEKLQEAGMFKSESDPEAARKDVRYAISDFAKQNKISPSTDNGFVRYPLGVLSTDHVGFVSYDLSRAGLPGEDHQHGGQEIRIFVYPYLSEALMVEVVAQGRIAPDAIVGRISLDAGLFVNAPALNLPAMQDANLTDWRLSPGSFAATPLSLIGADGCESYTPANFATSQVNIRQIVRIEGEVKPGFPRARVLEYSVSFIPIGHSLGQVLYTLPLAPGESTRLAVINWRRSDNGQRSEDTVLTESLVHDQTRDRLISETVEAALDEWQRGGSVMGGMAHGVGTAGGASASSSLFNIVGLGGGGGGSTGDMMSAGGAYSTSSGTRDLSADTMQKVTDRIHQASTAVREMHGTVVVQTDQAESQNIATRAFANNNRGHSLNILYHEVLQHFRVVTEYKKKYAAVLIPRIVRNFEDDAFILGVRHKMEPVTLDQSLRPFGYDALRAIDVIRKDQNRQLPWQAPFWQGDIHFKRFRFQFRITNDDTGSTVNIYLFRVTNQLLQLQYAAPTGATYNFNESEALDNNYTTSVLLTTEFSGDGLPWWDLDRFEIRLGSGGDDLTITLADIFGVDAGGNSYRLFWDPNYRKTIYNQNDVAVLQVIRQTPADRPIEPPPLDLPERIVDPEIYYQSRRLKDHLKAESAYYGRALDLLEDPNAYAISFEGLDFGNGKAIDEVAPTPLEIIGSKIAFPLIDQRDAKKDWGELPPAPVERLISLPTRGVFAEAKLGHCNVAEEIDETRFWRWDEHPNPFMASDIAPVQPVTPQTIQLDLQGTTLPNPIISIQNPPAAPDPTAMAAALKLMATPDIFRDMSGRTEVAGMIKNLIDGAVRMSENAVRAMEAASPKGGGGSSGSGASGQPGAGAQNPPIGGTASTTRTSDVPTTSPQDAQQQIKVSENQARKKVITPEQHTSNVQQSISEMNGAGKIRKDKKFNFQARDYLGQVSELLMKASVIDVGAEAVVLDARPFRGYGQITLSFATANPSIHVRIDTDPVSIHTQFMNIEVPRMSVMTLKPITLNETQDIVTATLTQRGVSAHFQGKTIDEAAQTLVDEYGGTLGIDKVVAVELLAKTSKQGTTKVGSETVITYDLSLPTTSYDISVS